MLAFVVAGALVAQRGAVRPEAVPRPAAATQAEGAIRGTVVGSGNEPLRKADVTLRSSSRGAGGTWSRTTDSSGTFAFENLPPGSYTLTVQRTGYVRSDLASRSGARGSGQVITLDASQKVTGLTIRMMPHAVIAGKVVDEDGEPMQHVPVQILRERWANGRRQLIPMSADSTNDLGEYRLSGLAPGRYFLLANISRPSPDPSLSAPQDQPEMTYAPYYFPGVNDPAQATPIAISEGQQMPGLDFQMRKAQTFRIRGKVLDETGAAAMYAMVMAVPIEGAFGPRAMAAVRNSEGTFEVAGVLPGSYMLVANRATRSERGRTMGQLPVQVGNRDLDGVVVQMAAPFEITGLVKVVGDLAPASNLRVALEPLQPGMPFFGGTPQMKENAFTIAGVSPGKYRFAVQNVPPGMYLKGVFVQGQDITAGAAISAAATGVEITLAPNAPTLSGSVVGADKQPVANAYVVVAPESGKADQYWLYRSATTDQSGSFAFRNLAPGQYRVFGFTDVEDGAWFNPDFLKPLEGRGLAVKLAEGSQETVAVTLAQ